MKTLTVLTLTLAATLALSGCKKDKNADQNAPAAGGQLLPRSVSDDMLPYDTVRSQAQLANPDADKSASKPSAGASQSADESPDGADEAALPSPQAAPQANDATPAAE